MAHITKYIVVFVCTLLLSSKVLAQPFSYVYIQGDKQTPFYVKLEEDMQPRYGKNYCIISQLAPGPINIQILFQQNAYPVQRFTIQVPENGYRGFMLTKKGGSFSLYDLQQQFYLSSGNVAEDDHAPAFNASDNYVNTGNTQAVAQNNVPPVKENTTDNTTNPVTASNQPQFIDNLELNNQHTVNTNPVVSTEDDLANNKSANNRKPGIYNSDCPQPISNEAFEAVYAKEMQKGESSRLKYLLNKLDDCYSVNQVRIMTKGLTNDPERYQFLKQAFHRVTDQSNFPSLEGLLSTQEWKDYFRLIMP